MSKVRLETLYKCTRCGRVFESDKYSTPTDINCEVVCPECLEPEADAIQKDWRLYEDSRYDEYYLWYKQNRNLFC
jgi:DNA-directed RNA polymerase subunit RPC12/RpoP